MIMSTNSALRMAKNLLLCSLGLALPNTLSNVGTWPRSMALGPSSPPLLPRNTCQATTLWNHNGAPRTSAQEALRQASDGRTTTFFRRIQQWTAHTSQADGDETHGPQSQHAASLCD